MLRRAGDDGGGEGFTVDSEAVFSFFDLADASAQVDFGAVGLQPLSGRFRQQLAEIDPEQQPVGNLADDAVVNIQFLGQAPNSASIAYRFDEAHGADSASMEVGRPPPYK